MLGSQNRSSGELRGRLGVALQVSGQVPRGQGRAPEKFRGLFHFREDKIMNICKKFSLVLVRTKPMSNNFLDDVLSKNRLFDLFPDAFVRILEKQIQNFYNQKKVFYKKKEIRKS